MNTEKTEIERIRKELEIGKQQSGFMPGRSTTDAVFALGTLTEKIHEDQQKLLCAFADLERAYDAVPK